MNAARYWRLIALEAHAGADLELSALHLYDGAGRVDAAATIASSIAPTTGTLAALQDEDTASTCRFAAAAVRAPGFAITWDFGAGDTADVLAPRLAGPSRDTFLASCTLQYSLDGQLWQRQADFASWDWPGVGVLTNVPAVGAPHFDKVSLLLHFDGADGSTTFTDSSPRPKTVTAIGGAKISTAQSRFGGASALFDGSGGYLTTPSHVDFDFGVGNFTMEAWIYYLGGAVNPVIFGRQEPGAGMAMQFRMVGSALDLTLRNPSGSSLVSFTGGSVPTNVWTHVACSRQDTTVRLFIYGSLVASGFSSNNIAAVRPLTLGAVDDTTLSGFFAGYIDEARSTKGEARYTANFTPPTKAFPGIGDAGAGGPVFLPPLRRAPAPWRTRIAAASPVPPYSTLSAPRLLLARDVEHGGPGTIYGTTKTKGTPNQPTHARVVLLHQRSKLPVRETWSDPVTGAFAFTGIDTTQQFLTLAEDAAGNFRPVAANRLTPEVLP